MRRCSMCGFDQLDDPNRDDEQVEFPAYEDADGNLVCEVGYQFLQGAMPERPLAEKI